MNSVAKGNKLEIEVKNTLEADGWNVFRQHRKPIFIKGKVIMVGCDIFGCDLVAKKLDLKTRWIQVSTPNNLKEKEQQILKAGPINLQHEDYEIWLRVPNKKEFQVYQLEVQGVTTQYYAFKKLGIIKAVTK